jgi:O-antigen ligase
MSAIITVLQEMFDIIAGAAEYLPSTKITIGICVALALLIYFKKTLGGLVTAVLATILIAHSFFSQGDIYQISPVRAIAGIILGLTAFLTDIYFLVHTLVDWRD